MDNNIQSEINLADQRGQAFAQEDTPQDVSNPTDAGILSNTQKEEPVNLEVPYADVYSQLDAKSKQGNIYDDLDNFNPVEEASKQLGMYYADKAPGLDAKDVIQLEKTAGNNLPTWARLANTAIGVGTKLGKTLSGEEGGWDTSNFHVSNIISGLKNWWNKNQPTEEQNQAKIQQYIDQGFSPLAAKEQVEDENSRLPGIMQGAVEAVPETAAWLAQLTSGAVNLGNEGIIPSPEKLAISASNRAFADYVQNRTAAFADELSKETGIPNETAENMIGRNLGYLALTPALGPIGELTANAANDLVEGGARMAQKSLAAVKLGAAKTAPFSVGAAKALTVDVLLRKLGIGSDGTNELLAYLAGWGGQRNINSKIANMLADKLAGKSLPEIIAEQKLILRTPDGQRVSDFLSKALEQRASALQEGVDLRLKSLSPEDQALATEKASDGSYKVGTDKLSGDVKGIRKDMERIAELQERSVGMKQQSRFIKGLTGLAELSANMGGHTMVGAGIGGSLSGAAAPTGDTVEPAAQGALMLGLLSGVASPFTAIHGMESYRLNEGGAKLMELGRDNITGVDGAPENVKNLLTKSAGFIKQFGARIVGMNREGLQKVLGTDQSPGYGFVSPDGKTIYINTDSARAVNHELIHVLQSATGEVLRKLAPEHMAPFEKAYQEALRKTGPKPISQWDYQDRLDLENKYNEYIGQGINSEDAFTKALNDMQDRTNIYRSFNSQRERDAEVGRHVLEHTPIEHFVGGEKGIDVIKGLFDGLTGRKGIKFISGFKAPVTPEDVVKMKQRLYRAGETVDNTPSSVREAGPPPVQSNPQGIDAKLMPESGEPPEPMDAWLDKNGQWTPVPFGAMHEDVAVDLADKNKLKFGNPASGETGPSEALWKNGYARIVHNPRMKEIMVHVPENLGQLSRAQEKAVVDQAIWHDYNRVILDKGHAYPKLGSVIYDKSDWNMMPEAVKDVKDLEPSDLVSVGGVTKVIKGVVGDKMLFADGSSAKYSPDTKVFKWQSKGYVHPSEREPGVPPPTKEELAQQRQEVMDSAAEMLKGLKAKGFTGPGRNYQFSKSEQAFSKILDVGEKGLSKFMDLLGSGATTGEDDAITKMFELMLGKPEEFSKRFQFRKRLSDLPDIDPKTGKPIEELMPEPAQRWENASEDKQKEMLESMKMKPGSVGKSYQDLAPEDQKKVDVLTKLESMLNNQQFLPERSQAWMDEHGNEIPLQGEPHKDAARRIIGIRRYESTPSVPPDQELFNRGMAAIVSYPGEDSLYIRKQGTPVTPSQLASAIATAKEKGYKRVFIDNGEHRLATAHPVWTNEDAMMPQTDDTMANLLNKWNEEDKKEYQPSKSSAGRRIYGWLSPSGEYHRARIYGHAEKAAELLKDLGDKQPYDAMSDEGWQRLESGKNATVLHVDRNNFDNEITPRQLKAIRDLARENGYRSVYDDISGRQLWHDLADQMMPQFGYLGEADEEGATGQKFYPGEVFSHATLGYGNKRTWRYNPETKKVIWWDAKPNEETQASVNHFLGKRGFQVDGHKVIRLGDSDESFFEAHLRHRNDFPNATFGDMPLMPETEAGKSLEEKGFKFKIVPNVAFENNYELHVADKNGFGAGHLDFRVNPREKSAHIDLLQTYSGYKKQGIGEAMYRELGHWLQQRGITSLDGQIISPIASRLRSKVFPNTKFLDPWQRLDKEKGATYPVGVTESEIPPAGVFHFMPQSDNPEAVARTAIRRNTDGKIFVAKGVPNKFHELIPNDYKELSDWGTMGAEGKYEDGFVDGNGKFLTHEQGYTRMHDLNQIPKGFQTEYKNELNSRELGQLMPDIGAPNGYVGYVDENYNAKGERTNLALNSHEGLGMTQKQSDLSKLWRYNDDTNTAYYWGKPNQDTKDAVEHFIKTKLGKTIEHSVVIPFTKHRAFEPSYLEAHHLMPEVNVGLNVGDKETLVPNDVIHALEKTGVKVVRFSVDRPKGKEATVVAGLDRPLTPEEAHSVSKSLHQEAIAQHVGNGNGELYGPKADQWKPFNSDLFIQHNGHSVSENLKSGNPTGEPLPPRTGANGIWDSFVARGGQPLHDQANAIGVPFDKWFNEQTKADQDKITKYYMGKGEAQYMPEARQSSKFPMSIEEADDLENNMMYPSSYKPKLNQAKVDRRDLVIGRGGRITHPENRGDVTSIAHMPETEFKDWVKQAGDRELHDFIVTAKPDELQQKLAAARELYNRHHKNDTNQFMPEWLPKNVKKYITPEEEKLLDGTANSFNRFMKIWSNKPTEATGVKYAQMGKEGKDWYKNVSQKIVDIFRQDANRFAALTASFSPNTPVETNIELALATWDRWVKAGRPTDEKTVRNLVMDAFGDASERFGGKLTVSVGFNTYFRNVFRTLSAEDASPKSLKLSGPKVMSYAKNLSIDPDALREVTNDSHIAQYIAQNPRADYSLFGRKEQKGKLVKTPEYIASSAHIRMVADRLTKITGETWTPRDAQAAIWSYILKKQGRGPERKAGKSTVSEIPSYMSRLNEYQDALTNPF